MDEEVKFYTEGLGMKVVRQREVNGARNVFVAYGEETLANKNGGESFVASSCSKISAHSEESAADIRPNR